MESKSAVGVVSVTAHVAAGLYRELVDAVQAGDLATAQAKHFALDPIQRAVMGHIQGAVSSKTILHWQGILPTSTVRLPLTAATTEEEHLIKADLAEAGITF